MTREEQRILALLTENIGSWVDSRRLSEIAQLPRGWVMQVTNNTEAVERWMRSHDSMSKAEQALFFFFLSFANGREEFRASVDELLLLLKCGRARFDYLANCLARSGLITIEWQKSGGHRWTIKERVDWTPAPLAAGKRFAIPVARARRRLSDDAEYRAFCMAQRRCERSGLPFVYSNFPEFLRRVGRRPEGKFRSGVPMFALFLNDRGEFEWRSTSRREVAR
jgi:hypothetical protein